MRAQATALACCLPIEEGASLGRWSHAEIARRLVALGMVLHLFGALSVAYGKVYGKCRLRKRFVDFQAFLLGTVIPEALRRGVHTLALILDNSTTYAPKQLERWLREQIEIQGWALNIRVYWLPVNASWLDQIEIWFSILQRKLLQLNHFERLGSLELAIMDFITYCNETAKPIQWSYTVEKLEKKLGVN